MRYSNYYFPFTYNHYNPPDVQQTDTERLHIQSDNIFIFPENLTNALALIQQAVSGESEDRAFYSFLIDIAPEEEEKQIITGIRNDEINHHSLFRQIFHDITGAEVPLSETETFTEPSSYCEGLKNAILGEQNAVRRYRQILFAMESRVHINMLTEIITDEIRHGSLYNYLYAKNGCRQ